MKTLKRLQWVLLAWLLSLFGLPARGGGLNVWVEVVPGWEEVTFPQQVYFDVFALPAVPGEVVSFRAAKIAPSLAPAGPPCWCMIGPNLWPVTWAAWQGDYAEWSGWTWVNHSAYECYGAWFGFASSAEAYWPRTPTWSGTPLRFGRFAVWPDPGYWLLGLTPQWQLAGDPLALGGTWVLAGGPENLVVSYGAPVPIVVWPMRGDVNLDGDIDYADVDALILLLSDGDRADSLAVHAADCNADGEVDFDDIDSFVELLS